MAVVNVFCHDNMLLNEAKSAAEKLGVPLNVQAGADYSLLFSDGRISLQNERDIKQGLVLVDFCSGGVAHRRRFGGGKGQLVAKAVGITAKCKPRVFDATAGLGKDAFVLATLGCAVQMMERSPVAHTLLADGLRRGRGEASEQDEELVAILQRMELLSGDSIEYMATTPDMADVVYLDPMFPERQKSAAVKKEMTAFHSVVGVSLEEDAALLQAALNAARYRVVVKRPRIAPNLGNVSPNVCYEGKSSRYDVYTLKSMKSL